MRITPCERLKALATYAIHSSLHLISPSLRHKTESVAAWNLFRKGTIDLEHRTRWGDIQRRLTKEAQAAQTQMEREPSKPFVYKTSHILYPKEFPYRDDSGNMSVWRTQGGRPYQEDRYEYGPPIYGVFDGHGGIGAADYLKMHLPTKIEEKLTQFGRSDEGIWNALKLAFVEIDEEFKKEHPKDTSGSTAVVAFLNEDDLWLANVGDSRAILQAGEKITQLTEDAKPSDPRYKKGIEKRGGVVLGYRAFYKSVNDTIHALAVARAIGDASIPSLTARPKITKFSIKDLPHNSHLLLASDGLWDVASTRQIGETLYEHREQSAADLAKHIMLSAYEAGSRDNQTVLVIKNELS